MGICKHQDDFIQEKLKWIVELSNGETIYQDDDRPGEDEPKAWIRLKKYIQEKSLSIKKIYIQFFSHVEEVADANADGYYYCQAVDAVAFSGDAHQTNTINYYIIGSLANNKIHVKKWMVPEILLVSTETREVNENDERLIINCG